MTKRKQASETPTRIESSTSVATIAIEELPSILFSHFGRRRPSPLPKKNDEGGNATTHHSMSCPNFLHVIENPMPDDACTRETIAIEDQTSTWNLDIETGEIKQEVLGTTVATNSSSANKFASGLCTTTSNEYIPTKRGQCCSAGVLRDAVNQIDQAGGDFTTRLGAALRASLGSGFYFSIMVFTYPIHKYLGAIWIGNIFLHSSLQGNVGEALQAARGFAKSIILTTLVSWPVALFLGQTTEHVALICLPILTVVLSLVIMTCPFLTSPNLMILVMYVVIAAPPRFPSTTSWEPISYVGSYFIGLGMAVLMNLIPIFPPRFLSPNTATQQVHFLMERLSKDFFLLFVHARHYTYTTGRSPKVARAASATIEVLVDRITTTIPELKRLLPSVTLELRWTQWRTPKNATQKDIGPSSSTSSSVGAQNLALWIDVLESVVIDLKMLRCALNSRFLGEQENENARDADPAMSPALSTRHVRRIIAEELGQDYHQFIDSLICLCVACNRRADPRKLRTFYASTTSTSPKEEGHNGKLHSRKLEESLNKTRLAFGRALHQVTKEVHEARTTSSCGANLGTTLPVFAHLARRSTSMNSLLSIAAALLKFSATLNNEGTPNNNRKNNVTENMHAEAADIGLFATVVGWCCNSFRTLSQELFETWWKPKWLWRDAQKRRLALKTSVGMMFASLWISVPQMWEIAQPFGFWPGLTVASVNLANTGSSFHKAIDRLVGTFFAAAYALLVVEFFSGDQDGAKIPAITVFTFAVIYLQKDDHAYQYSYAATSIGSMMYGSGKVGYDVQGYIPQRIQLIFVGVITFAVVELFFFPRSSRLIVETQILQYFELVRGFFKKAEAFAQTMQVMTPLGKETGKSENDRMVGNNSLISAPEGCSLMEPAVDECLQELMQAERVLRSTSLTLKTELQSALMEPYFGFSQKLHSQSLNGMVSEICESETQAILLVKALKMVAQYTEHSEARCWPGAYASFLEMAGKQMDIICRDLSAAYPDGYFRPQGGNTLRAIGAAAAFRDFREVRYSIITSWSHQFEMSAAGDLLDPNELLVMAITTSFMLEFCRHLQLTGRRMEWSAGNFPTF